MSSRTMLWYEGGFSTLPHPEKQYMDLRIDLRGPPCLIGKDYWAEVSFKMFFEREWESCSEYFTTAEDALNWVSSWL